MPEATPPPALRSPRVHRNLVEAVAHALGDVVLGKGTAEDRVGLLLRSNRRWGARDRAFVAEGVYETVRAWRRLSFLAGTGESTEPGALVRVVGTWLVLGGATLPGWEEFQGLDPAAVAARAGEADRDRRIRLSIADAADELGAGELGEARWEREVAAMDGPARVGLRVNRIRTTPEALARRLAESGIDTTAVAGALDGLVLASRRDLSRHPLYLAGHFEIQDPSSQLVAPFLGVRAGETIVDACAGAGGKALHLASLLGNQGRVLALDPREGALAELRRRAARAGAACIETVAASPEALAALAGTADRVLLDVPCTGSGTWRHAPEGKLRLRRAALEATRRSQDAILEAHREVPRRGGVLVYATCSILPSENREAVEAFLARTPGYALEADGTVWPSESGFDGFYLARLARVR